MAASLIQGTAGWVLSYFVVVISVFIGGPEAPRKSLKVTRETPVKDVQQSQIGYRDTLIFYTFKKESTVLRLQIENKDQSFPMRATLFFFAENIDEDGIKKWINNQHSDGIFVDAPQPTGTHELPAANCKVSKHKYIDREMMGIGEYDNYKVTFEIKSYDDKNGLTLKGFTGETKVHVPIRP